MVSPIYFNLKTFEPLLKHKLHEYADAFLLMHQNNGRLPYPDLIIEYFDKLGLDHWAENYLPSKVQKHTKELENKSPYLIDFVASNIGSSPTIEQASNFLNQYFSDLPESFSEIEEFKFLNETPDPASLDEKSDEAKAQEKEVLVLFLVTFYNDLSIAVHGESIFSLIYKAVEENDDVALAKAIQIDPTVLSYFEKRVRLNSMQGNSDFFDTLSYRFKNPTTKGVIKHPLLWIFFKDLLTLRCLHNRTTNRQILDFYNDAVRYFPQFMIDDEQTVQRQRRKFLQKYRLTK